MWSSHVSQIHRKERSFTTANKLTITHVILWAMQLNISITIPDKGQPIVTLESSRRREQHPKICPQCSTSFIPFRANQQFCCQKHGDIYRRNMKHVKAEIQSSHGKRPKDTSMHLHLPDTVSKDPFYQQQLKKAAKRFPSVYPNKAQ